MGRSLVKEAVKAFTQGRYAEAQNLYRQLATQLGEKNFRANLALCQRRMGGKFRPHPTELPLRDLRVAAVMDEFTFHSYSPECQLLQLHPEHCLAQLEEFQPHLLFIESAWQGFNQLWKLKISTNGPEINACIQWCKAQGIPTLFWNKEDPVHFSTFIPLAKRVDYIFTTDIDCVPRYKLHVGHDNVHLLSFAAQPKIHNPIELYDRKDAFNFAGSYYLRYPERQRDFSTLIDTVKTFRPIDIYDRNADNPHPHYTFPDHYKPMILGKLPFAEIDRAYKGYRYGINMNTIKQSQTMFARRVYELLASNTVVVSNFSRGMRLMFGDLVVSSDNAGQLKERMQFLIDNDTIYRKFRLLGLRKVMSEHTYAHRLAYICSKITGMPSKIEEPAVVLLAVAHNTDEAERLIVAFNHQYYENKQLLIVGAAANLTSSRIQCFPNTVACLAKLDALSAENLIGVLDPHDHYGPYYLTDLVLASSYSSAAAFGKHTHYYTQGDSLTLNAPNGQYRTVNRISARAALARRSAISLEWFAQCLAAPGKADFTLHDMLATDEFNYIKNGAALTDGIKAQVGDLTFVDQGVSFNHLLNLATMLPATTTQGNTANSKKLPQLDAAALHVLFSEKAKITLTLANGKLQLKSALESGKHVYLYAHTIKTREELNLVFNSHIQLSCNLKLDLRTVFEFQDKNSKKISHQINLAGENAILAIPNNCTQIRLGLRVEGPGEAIIEKLVLGSNPERPAAIIYRSPYLVLSKQYPAYDDLYKYGFLHSRIRAYKKAGLVVDIYRISNDPMGYREFEGFDVVTGDAQLLDATLATGQIKHVLVHLLDTNMWWVLQKYLDQIRVTVWIHGAEIQVWQRRKCEFELMTELEVTRQKKLSDQRKIFWKGILDKLHPNLHLIFVSEYLKNEVEADIGIRIPDESYSIIHNYIDKNMFPYKEKVPDDRLKILSIRSYSKRVYANDLTVKAILKLSQRPFFNKFQFTLVGDGDLFDETVRPLRIFNNVIIEKRFLSHAEVAEYHSRHGVFLIPTRMDTQGVSRDEARSSGLVCITTEVAAIPEFCTPDDTIIVEPENPVAIAEALASLYQNPDLFNNISARASLSIENKSSYEQTIGKEISFIY